MKCRVEMRKSCADYLEDLLILMVTNEFVNKSIGNKNEDVSDIPDCISDLTAFNKTSFAYLQCILGASPVLMHPGLTVSGCVCRSIK